MATGREGRAERLNERLRGAQRANVEDDTFSLDLGGLGQPTDPPPITRQTPNTSAKRKTLGSVPKTVASQRTGKQSARSAAKDPYALLGSSKTSGGEAEASTAVQSPGSATIRESRMGRMNVPRKAAAPQDDDDSDALETLPALPALRSPTRVRASGAQLEEIAESPAVATTSGSRHSVRSDGVAGSTARLQEALDATQDLPESSSPLARKSRRSDAVASERSKSTSGGNTSRLARATSDEGAERVETPASDHEEKEIDDAEAAKVLGRKRPRRSMPERSLELGSDPQEEEEPQAPPAKRRRGGPAKSPAAQKQPAPKKRRKSTFTAKSKTKARQKHKNKKKADAEDGSDTELLPVEIFVQRQVNINKDDADPLHSAMPFANRLSENVVDVFSQVCDEVIDYTLAHYEDMGHNSPDAATKKMCRIKIRAIEAYREELASRMLQHAIHLNHWYSLRKQVRHVQKTKLSLRAEILRLRGEREQVALRMDAIRIKHEADTRDATIRLDTSALMHDIELAVGQGQNAPELSRAEQKKAELANLELAVAQVSDQASSSSATGGLLGQVKEFNAFLERAAIALETT